MSQMHFLSLNEQRPSTKLLITVIVTIFYSFFLSQIKEDIVGHSLPTSIVKRAIQFVDVFSISDK